MLDLRRLVLLREVHLRGSIASASRALGVSSSAISQQLAKLEAEAGMPLLEQIGRKVHLTQAGEVLARRADEAVTILEGAEADLDRRKERIQGTVRFAAFSTFALRHLPGALARMRETHPDVVIEFTQVEPREALESIAGRRADIAVTDEFTGIPRSVDTSLVRTRLMRDRLRAFAARPHMIAADLADMPWVFEPSDSDAAAWSRRTCREAGFEPNVRFESPDLRVHHALVVSGEAAAFLPDMLFRRPARSLEAPDTAVDWPGGEDAMYRDVYAVTRRGSGSRPAVAALLGHLRSLAGAG